MSDRTPEEQIAFRGMIITEITNHALARIAELETALIRWHTDEGDCECREIHMLNLCRSCSADINLRELAAAVYAARKDTPA